MIISVYLSTWVDASSIHALFVLISATLHLYNIKSLVYERISFLICVINYTIYHPLRRVFLRSDIMSLECDHIVFVPLGNIT